MTKRQLIDEIVTLNQTAEPAFLAKFDPGELDEYLRHLRLAGTPRMRRGMGRYRKYFDNCPRIAFTPAPPEALQRFQNEDTDVNWPLQVDETDQQPAPATQFTPDLEPYDSASDPTQSLQAYDQPEILFEIVDDSANSDRIAPEIQSAAEETTHADPISATQQYQSETVEDDDFEEESDTWLY